MRWAPGPQSRGPAAEQFVVRLPATDEGNAGFVPIPERIATSDQDGALWVEQPIYGHGRWLGRVSMKEDWNRIFA